MLVRYAYIGRSNTVSTVTNTFFNAFSECVIAAINKHLDISLLCSTTKVCAVAAVGSPWNSRHIRSVRIMTQSTWRPGLPQGLRNVTQLTRSISNTLNQHDSYFSLITAMVKFYLRTVHWSLNNRVTITKRITSSEISLFISQSAVTRFISQCAATRFISQCAAKRFISQCAVTRFPCDGP